MKGDINRRKCSGLVSNNKRDIQGQSRTLAMVPFDRPHTISC